MRTISFCPFLSFHLPLSLALTRSHSLSAITSLISRSKKALFIRIPNPLSNEAYCYSNCPPSLCFLSIPIGFLPPFHSSQTPIQSLQLFLFPSCLFVNLIHSPSTVRTPSQSSSSPNSTSSSTSSTTS